ncbi:MAG TPA: hypothetical protein PK598_09220, partial [Thermoanaerobaculia bacterium]|nr:hypothetical protein [Thermoanaerobaculia bacterium]
MAEPTPSPAKTRIRVGLAGKTVEKEVQVAPDDAPPLAEGQPRRVFGKAGPRLDGKFKATGRAVYTHDVRRDGLLFGRILRSPHAHARILAVDTSALAQMPGVVVELLEKKEVRYHGEAVLALAAPSPAAAEDALHAVTVRYEVLPHVVDLEAAMAADAPLVFEKPVEERRTAGDAPGAGGAVPLGLLGLVTAHMKNPRILWDENKILSDVQKYSSY